MIAVVRSLKIPTVVQALMAEVLALTPRVTRTVYRVAVHTVVMRPH
jgi:ABC-type antimicrobial peptide transport system permease subunit